MSKNSFDAIVIGGGPCGSSAAATLAMKGRRVAVLEKDRFPRYHIGESLLPYCYYSFERLGVLKKMKRSSFVKKYSVQFVNTDGAASHPFYFYEQLEGEASQTWQVLRSEFDQLLLDSAREKGATAYEETAVRDFLYENGRVVGVRTQNARGESAEFHAPITIDATGRDALAISRYRWRVRDPHLDKIAIWTYFHGAQRDAGRDEGATTVAYVPEKGWFWYIPLANDTVSVGIVAEKEYLHGRSNGAKDPESIFYREVKENPWIEKHLAPGKQTGPFWVTGEYSYRSQHCATDGLVLAGDAFAFLDPVFSSGVFLALRSGEMAAEATHAALAANDVSAERFTEYGRQFCFGIESMRRLVYAFYDHEFSFRTFVDAYPQMKADVTDCLMGNLFRDFTPMFRAISEFAKVPAPLSHGGPAALDSAQAPAIQP